MLITSIFCVSVKRSLGALYWHTVVGATSNADMVALTARTNSSHNVTAQRLVGPNAKCRTGEAHRFKRSVQRRGEGEGCCCCGGAQVDANSSNSLELCGE